MNKKIKILLLLSMLIQLVGCATHMQTQGSVPPIENSEPVIAQPGERQPEKSVDPALPSVPRSQPQSQTQNPVQGSLANRTAVTSLVTQARAQYNAKNYHAAIATAERALRIDRRSPEVYLILAQSYVQLANTQLALQFVQQGIRYAQTGTELARTLMQVRESLPK